MGGNCIHSPLTAVGSGVLRGPRMSQGEHRMVYEVERDEALAMRSNQIAKLSQPMARLEPERDADEELVVVGLASRDSGIDALRNLNGNTLTALFGALQQEHLVFIIQALEQALACRNADEPVVYQFEVGRERYKIEATAEMALLRALDAVLEMRARGLLKPAGELLPGGAADLAWRKTLEKANEECAMTGERFRPLQRTVRLIVEMLARGLLELDVEAAASHRRDNADSARIVARVSYP